MKPLPLTAEMALAAILGTKTETRRPVRPQPVLNSAGLWRWPDIGAPAIKHPAEDIRATWQCDEETLREAMAEYCTSPFGLPGEELWLREPGRVFHHKGYLGHKPGVGDVDECNVRVHYLADGTESDFILLPTRFLRLPRPGHIIGFWPKWATRCQGIPNGIFREAARFKTVVLEVRVERLQEITEAGARAEGIADGGCLNCGHNEPCGCDVPAPDARDSFINLWDRIYGKRPGLAWADNPWVSVTAWDRMVAI